MDIPILKRGARFFYRRLRYALPRRSNDTYLPDSKLVAEYFDTTFYLQAYPRVSLLMTLDPLHHFMTQGWKKGCNPNCDFCTQTYLAVNDDVRDSGINPFLHYLKYGQEEGRLPMQKDSGSFAELSSVDQTVLRMADEFDEEYYLWMYPDVKDSGGNPLQHYNRYGWREGRNPNAEFNTTFYTNSNPDIKESGLNPFYHFLMYGRTEGRKASATVGFGNTTIPFEVSDQNPLLCLPIALGNKISNSQPIPAPSIFVQLHAYYLDGLEDILAHLKMIPVPFDLCVTTDSKSKSDAIAQTVDRMELSCKVEIVLGENRGRDVAPFLITATQRMMNYDVGLHLHVKKSMEKEEVGTAWLKHNLKCLLHDKVYISSILTLFEQEKDCGLLFPELYAPIRPFIHWSQNKPLAKNFLESIGIPGSQTDGELVFPVGMMFWFRPAAIRQLAEFNGGYEYFPEEPIRDDATVAHAIERSVNYISTFNGYRHRTIRPIYGEQMPNPTGSPKVSVVIPIYNAGPFLHHAVQSVLRQKEGIVSTEIILVDNGSTDDSLATARFYEKSYAHVRVFEQAIRGAGAARNMGLAHAQGAYVTFLDADDMLSVDAIETLYMAAVGDEADMVSSRLRMFDEEQIHQAMPDGLGLHNTALDIHHFTTPRTNYWIDAAILKEMGSIFADFGACAKLYRTEYLNTHDIRFVEGVNFEDNEFVYRAYLNARSLVTLSQTTYYYRKYKQEQGATQSTEKSTQAIDDQLRAITSITQMMDTMDNEQLQTVIQKSLIQKIAWLLEGMDTLPDYMLPACESLNAVLSQLDTAKHMGEEYRLLQLLSDDSKLAKLK